MSLYNKPSKRPSNNITAAAKMSENIPLNEADGSVRQPLKPCDPCLRLHKT